MVAAGEHVFFGGSNASANGTDGVFTANCLRWVSKGVRSHLRVASSGHRPVLGFARATERGVNPVRLASGNDGGRLVYAVDGAERLSLEDHRRVGDFLRGGGALLVGSGSQLERRDAPTTTSRIAFIIMQR